MPKQELAGLPAIVSSQVGMACVALILLAASANAQSPAAICEMVRSDTSIAGIRHYWRDKSPHREIRLRVDSVVTVDVLDWGGNASGTPVLWIAGANSTAHVFDDLAPQFIALGRQLGLTPRGQPPSTVPDSGYAIADRLRDVVALLDSLHIPRVILVGHSQAGDLLTAMSVWHPERTAGLLYLDAAYDRSTPGPPIPHELIHVLPTGAGTLQGVLAARCAHGPLPSPAEITETTFQWSLVSPAPERRAAIAAASRRHTELVRGALDYWIGSGRVREPHVPVLFIYALHGNRDEPIDLLGIRDDSSTLRRYMRWWEGGMQLRLDRERAAVENSWPNAELTILPDASHMLMWSNPIPVSRAVMSFLLRVSERH